MKFATLEGKRVAVWGYGREGRSALAALRRHLPRQPVSLFCSAAELDCADIAEPVAPRTVAPDADILAGFDYVVKSPGISAYRPEIAAARARGTVFTSGTALWFGEHPDARVIGITGTKGKSTTAALAAHLARSVGVRTALAGNIGLPLLDLDGQQADLWVVELSSFQAGEAGPLAVGVVTCLYEEHLDWHGTRERYVADKLKLADVSRSLVVNAGQPELMTRTAWHPRRVTFGGTNGWHVACEDSGTPAIFHGAHAVVPLAGMGLHGMHNALNTCAALTALDQAGVSIASPAAAIDAFKPLPHRLQHLGKHDGFDWVDDSISTTPQAVLAALESLGTADITLILGGHDRGLDWTGFAGDIANSTLRIIVQGASAQRVAQAVADAAGEGIALQRTQTLQQAVLLARQVSPAGATIVLSPGAPSFDQFRDYAERGRCFAELAGFHDATTRALPGLGIA